MYMEEDAALLPQREGDAIKFGWFVKIVGFVWFTPEPESIPDLPEEYLTFPSYPCFAIVDVKGHKSYLPIDSVLNGHFKVSPLTEKMQQEIDNYTANSN